MEEDKITKEWRRFAKSVDGVIQVSDANRINHDSRFVVNTERARLELMWGNAPQSGSGTYVTAETNFYFQLPPDCSLILTIKPRDFFSTLFQWKKIKTGLKELDRKYVFSGNTEDVILQLQGLMKKFDEKNPYSNFSIGTERVEDSPVLTLFVPELMTSKPVLDFYYNFGIEMADLLSAACKKRRADK